MLFDILIYCSPRYHNAILPSLWVASYYSLVDDSLVCILSGNRPHMAKIFNSICIPEVWADDDDFRTSYEDYLGTICNCKNTDIPHGGSKGTSLFLQVCIIIRNDNYLSILKKILLMSN